MLANTNFGISLVKDFVVIGKSNFSFKCTTIIKKTCIDITQDDMLMNYMHLDEMAMNGSTLWQGAHEKDPHFFQITREATTVEGDLVLDYSAPTSE